MEKKTINITISGVTLTGKSRIHYKIREVFKEMGFEIESDGDTDFDTIEEFDSFMKVGIENTLDTLKDRVILKIKEEQLPRV